MPGVRAVRTPGDSGLTWLRAGCLPQADLLLRFPHDMFEFVEVPGQPFGVNVHTGAPLYPVVVGQPTFVVRPLVFERIPEFPAVFRVLCSVGYQFLLFFL